MLLGLEGRDQLRGMFTRLANAREDSDIVHANQPQGTKVKNRRGTRSDVKNQLYGQRTRSGKKWANGSGGAWHAWVHIKSTEQASTVNFASLSEARTWPGRDESATNARERFGLLGGFGTRISKRRPLQSLSALVFSEKSWLCALQSFGIKRCRPCIRLFCLCRPQLEQVSHTGLNDMALS